MHWFATGIAIFAALISTGGAFFAWKSWQGAITAEWRVRGHTSRLAAVESDHENLKVQHQRLAGKFHATLAQKTPVVEDKRPMDRNELRRQHLPGVPHGS